jgi:hypothetical protein
LVNIAAQMKLKVAIEIPIKGLLNQYFFAISRYDNPIIIGSSDRNSDFSITSKYFEVKVM